MVLHEISKPLKGIVSTYGNTDSSHYASLTEAWTNHLGHQILVNSFNANGNARRDTVQSEPQNWYLIDR